MFQRDYVKRLLIIGLFVVILGGWLLHIRLHPIAEHIYGYVPFIAGIIGVFALTIMFLFNSTVAYAYVLNGMLVIIGVITMADFSIDHMPAQKTFLSMVLNTLFPDILILGVVFFVGKALFELNMMRSWDDKARTGRYLRYPNTGWWLVHLIGMSVVYYLGSVLWK